MTIQRGWHILVCQSAGGGRVCSLGGPRPGVMLDTVASSPKPAELRARTWIRTAGDTHEGRGGRRVRQASNTVGGGAGEATERLSAMNR